MANQDLETELKLLGSRVRRLLESKDQEIGRLRQENANRKEQIDALSRAVVRIASEKSSAPPDFQNDSQLPALLHRSSSEKPRGEVQDEEEEVEEDACRGLDSGRASIFNVDCRWQRDLSVWSRASMNNGQEDEDEDEEDGTLRVTSTRSQRIRKSMSGYLGHKNAMLLQKIIQRVQLPRSPNSGIKMVHDYLGLMFIIYDFFCMPLQAFDLRSTWFTLAMDWITLLFWTWDVVMSNLVSHYSDGELVLEQRKITLAYLKSWFLIDVIVLVPGWYFLGGTDGQATDESGDPGSWTRVALLARGFRMLRLLRVLKLGKIMDHIYDLVDSQYMFIALQMVRMIILIVMLNHGIACLWFWIGKMGLESGQASWLGDIGITTAAPGSFSWCYTSALHWSLTQFTPASMDVVARSVPERVMSITVVFFALITFSSFVASITNAMTALRTLREDSKKQFWLLRRYLTQQKIGKATRARVLQFLQHHESAHMSQLTAGDVAILTKLSEPLKNLIAYELKKKHINKHPLFEFFEEHMQSSIMIKLCHVVLKMVTYASEDVVFHAAEEGTRMFFIASGTLVYRQTKGDEITCRLLCPQSWLAEPVLWTSTWMHRGQLKANTYAELAVLDQTTFHSVVQVHKRPWSVCTGYAQRFVQVLNSIPAEDLSDLLPSPITSSSSFEELGEEP